MKLNQYKHIFTFLIIIFIILPIEAPFIVSQLVSTIFGKLCLVLLSCWLIYLDKTLGVFALIAVYELIRRSENVIGLYQSREMRVTEKIRAKHIDDMNESSPWKSKTLEEEMVDNIPKTTTIEHKSSFKPILNNIHDAAVL